MLLLFNKLNKLLTFIDKTILRGAMNTQPDRVTSFSIKPTDVKALTELQKLKTYSAKTRISFSFLIIQAIEKLNKELNLK